MKKLSEISKNFVKIIGDGQKKIQPSEYVVINSQRKCIYANRSIPKGMKIRKSYLTIKGPAGGILPKYLNLVEGRVTKKDISKDEPLTWEII